jgi:uncharacterized protein (TIRG00374 family)
VRARNSLGGTRWWNLGLRVAVSVTLLLWLLHNLQGGWQKLQDVEPAHLAPAALVFVLSTILGALQWGLLLRHAGLPLSLGRLTRLYWVGLFFNNFLPSNVGGDLVKVADVSLSTGEMSRAVAGTILDRVIGLAALTALGLLAALSSSELRHPGLSVLLLSGVWLALAIAGALLLSRRASEQIARITDKLRMARLGERLRALMGEFPRYRRSPAFLTSIFLLALLVQFLRVLTHVFVAQALEIPMSMHLVLGLYLLVPVLGVAIVLPISFNGLGLRELIAIRLLPRIGIAAPEAFALQLTTYLVQVAVSGVGGLFFALRLVRGWTKGRSGASESEG